MSRTKGLKYTASGSAIYEFTMAVPQKHFDKASIGHFELMLWGKSAEDNATRLKVGNTLTLEGSLWTRSFRNRQGKQVSETKVLVHLIEGE